MAYVYRFLDANDKIIYVGYTGRELSDRIKEHFEKGHLDSSCYNSVATIEYKKYKTNSDAMILENYYINKYKPRFNKLNKVEGKVNVNISDEQNWKLYKRMIPRNATKRTDPIPKWKMIVFDTVMWGIILYTFFKMVIAIL